MPDVGKHPYVQRTSASIPSYSKAGDACRRVPCDSELQAGSKLDGPAWCMPAGGVDTLGLQGPFPVWVSGFRV